MQYPALSTLLIRPFFLVLLLFSRLQVQQLAIQMNLLHIIIFFILLFFVHQISFPYQTNNRKKKVVHEGTFSRPPIEMSNVNGAIVKNKSAGKDVCPFLAQ